MFIFTLVAQMGNATFGRVGVEKRGMKWGGGCREEKKELNLGFVRE